MSGILNVYSPQTKKTDSVFPLVAPLTYFDRNSLALAGGKGANLGELIKAGFDVPPGFVITTAAYDLLLQTNDLQKHIQSALAALQTDDPVVVKGVSRQIHAAIRDAAMPNPIHDALVNAYHRLGSNAVAVRSSATAEDLPEAAFAGQQETLLNVIGEPALLEAVRACRPNMFNDLQSASRRSYHVDRIQPVVPANVASSPAHPAHAAGSLPECRPPSSA